MNELENTIIDYEKACERIAIFFAHKYFGDYYEYSYGDWVGCDIGGVIAMNDYFFNVDTMLHYLKYKYSKKQMFEHYDYAIEEATHDRHPVCIRDWKKMKKGGIL